ncbi:hypothetical protein KPH14_004051 [Odynerus spinipes]|uniref:Uncharacterized protein n=1 Tax=Odynerus spinipes TaxID=1348599 RepID=A0AAD9RXW3_9HYME|nr:hypothetical protein KPH14_004051 [Odynerus spinipes]
MSANTFTFHEATIQMSPEQVEELNLCIKSKEATQTATRGALYGGALVSLPLLLFNTRITKSALVALTSLGALYGYVLSRITVSANCIQPKSTEESLFDTDTPLQTALFDELPSTSDSAPLSVEEQKEPKRTVTYSELRQRNRQLYGSKPKSSWVNESNVLPNPDVTKRRTKYGDVWEMNE